MNSTTDIYRVVYGRHFGMLYNVKYIAEADRKSGGKMEQ